MSFLEIYTYIVRLTYIRIITNKILDIHCHTYIYIYMYDVRF